VCEAKSRQPGRGVDLVTPTVTHLLCRGAVVAKPIGFDNQAAIGPIEVDAKPFSTRRVSG
jgi:hypothetical protein